MKKLPCVCVDTKITPTFPRANSLTARALMRLLSGRQFTHRDFQNETGTYRLSEYVRQLRTRHNWPIETRDETAPTSDPTGRTATYGRYLIQPEILSEQKKISGERIEKFIDSVRRFESKKGD